VVAVGLDDPPQAASSALPAAAARPATNVRRESNCSGLMAYLL
jgi:hypothetical protein